MADIETHKKTLLQIWDHAARGDVTSDLESFNKALEKDGLGMPDLFNTVSFDEAASEDVQKQIEIRGHINQFVGLESQSIPRQDRLAALEEADEHMAQAFSLAKSTTINPAMQRSFHALQTAIVQKVEPLMTSLKPKP